MKKFFSCTQTLKQKKKKKSHTILVSPSNFKELTNSSLRRRELSDSDIRVREKSDRFEK